MSSRTRIAIPVPTSIDIAYNRQCLPLYLAAIERSGGEAVCLPADVRSASSLAATCAGVLLPGSLADVDPARYGQLRDPNCGSSDPIREAIDCNLLDNATHRQRPVFGICYGLQMINVYRGGSLLQHLSVMPINHAAGPGVAIAHSAVVSRESVLATLAEPELTAVEAGTGRLAVNSSHHQGVHALGDGLRSAAICPQDGVIEALEANPTGSLTGYIIAVQWHPERSYDTSATSRSLFDRFISEARR